MADGWYTNQVLVHRKALIMNTYAATFIAGTREIVLRRLKQFTLKQLKITYSDDSFIVFSSSLPEVKIANLRFFNNIFKIFTKSRNIVSLDQFLEQAIANSASVTALSGKRFRLFIMNADDLQNVGLTLRQKLTQAIAAKYKMTESSHRPDIELWFILRRSGFGIFGWKLPHIQFKHGNRPAGVLRPELAHILGLVANLGSRDIVLDPFAGSGAILEEALAGFHVKQAVAVERDRKMLDELKKISKLEVVMGDATDLLLIKSNSINKVITDPPRGSFTKSSNQEIDKLYSEAFKEIARVLKPGGITVVLSCTPKAVQQAQSITDLSLIKEYPVLVSGH